MITALTAVLLSVTPFFGGLEFNKPLWVTHAPGSAGRVFVVEQGGRIWAVDKGGRRSLFLNISDRTHAQGEMGLLGLAFHPRYRENGLLYVYYSAIGTKRLSGGKHDNVLARFFAPADRSHGDAASESVLLRVSQPYGNHNGGCIIFGPDGYLYIGKGDGGSAGDPHGHGQRLDVLLGKILRIDVDKTSPGLPYGIPADNPFASRADARPEVWAYGIRNPWRFSFDRKTGELWLGDVGQDKIEEVDLVAKGGNYGWNLFEGTRVFRPDQHPDPSRYVMPVAEYEHGGAGNCIIGGYVYRGAKHPSLQGVYLYADYGSGRIRGLRYEKGRLLEDRELLAAKIPITSFGEDEEGELYVTAFDGKVYRIGLRD